MCWRMNNSYNKECSNVGCFVLNQRMPCFYVFIVMAHSDFVSDGDDDWIVDLIGVDLASLCVECACVG